MVEVSFEGPTRNSFVAWGIVLSTCSLIDGVSPMIITSGVGIMTSSTLVLFPLVKLGSLSGISSTGFFAPDMNDLFGLFGQALG